MKVFLLIIIFFRVYILFITRWLIHIFLIIQLLFHIFFNTLSSSIQQDLHDVTSRDHESGLCDNICVLRSSCSTFYDVIYMYMSDVIILQVVGFLMNGLMYFFKL